jgi:phosphoglycerate dehydrogenase-like enzyme
VTGHALPRLLVLDDREGLVRSSPAFELLRDRCRITVLDQSLDRVDDTELTDVRFLMAIRERTRLDAAALDQLPALELILQTGSHAYHVDASELARRRIPVALGRRGQVVRSAVPELTLLLMLACVRRLGEASRAMATGDWPAVVGGTLDGRRLGILGLGRHGCRVAALASALGMAVAAWDRAGEREGMADPGGRPGPDGVVLVPLSTLLATSDVVSVHVRLSDESRGLLGRDQLFAMKPGSVLVNTARGAVVDEDALVAALREGPLAAAGLDVFSQEPLPADHPLRSMANAVLTPHVGWTVEEVFTESAAIAARQVDEYLDGRLDQDELLDPDVLPPDDALGGIRGAPGP